MDQETPPVTVLYLDEQTEASIRRLLDGEIDHSHFSGSHVEGQARLLHILNLTYKAVEHERVVHKAIEHLGEMGNILHLPSQDPNYPYVKAVLEKGRLLTPNEYGGMLTSYEGLEYLFKQAVEQNDQPMIRSVVDRAMAMIPNKALVLARMEGYTYEAVLNEFMQSSGSVELVDVDQFINYVAMHAPELEIRQECELMLSRDLAQLDHLLSWREMQRTPETRLEFVKEVLATAPKYHFVIANRMHSKAFYEAYPEQFTVVDIARAGVQWKCEGECMDCTHWKTSLGRPGPRYGAL